MVVIQKTKKYLSLVKFSHTLFAFPFALIGYFIAIAQPGYSFDPLLLLWVSLCMVFARTAAMAFNRFLDRRYDELNPRTKVREIPSGAISSRSAMTLVIISTLAFVAVTYFINMLCFALSPVALLVILGYSYTKRFTALCHLVLGVGLSLSPIGAWLAVTEYFDLLPILFSFAVLFWVSGFDVIYALQDADFDAANKLHSIPSRLGLKKAIILSIILHLFSGAAVIAAGFIGNFGLLYWIGCGLFNMFLVFQHFLVKPGDLSRINLAFFTLNGIASLAFSAFVIADLYLPM
ncbi:MAG: UbiA-like polyprenyltransferase [Bacteroidota bacterium]